MNIKHYKTIYHHQKGLTLVELMVALTLSLILLAGVVQIFIANKSTYRMNEALSRVQENGRFATMFLINDIRMAGYTGCYRGDSASVENLLNDQSNYGWDLSTMIYGNEANGISTWSPALDATISGLGINSGTDVITIRHLAGSGIDLVDPYSNSAQLFVGPEGSSLEEGAILMVTDCTQSSLFQLTNLQATGGLSTGFNVVHASTAGYTPGNTAPATTSNDYSQGGAQVAALETSIYYIKDNALGIPALYRSALSVSGGSTNVLSEQELIEGIQDMQILYGVDTDASADGFANRYMTATAVEAAGSWDQVVSARITLLARSIEDNVTSDEIFYDYNGTTGIDPNDKRLRRVFTTTIAIRNRTL